VSDLTFTKQCTKCGDDKPIESFAKRNNRKSGVQSSCKECNVKNKQDAQYYRDWKLKAVYGISRTEYDSLRAAQNHCCAICGIHEKHAKNTTLCVDHNHNTGEVRGLLCHKCNAAIGLLQDSHEFCTNAATYLKEYL
jgi:hypothetical protein